MIKQAALSSLRNKNPRQPDWPEEEKPRDQTRDLEGRPLREGVPGVKRWHQEL
ncbi:unnamed protein product [Brassica oleracea var. botrytis]